MDTRAQQPDLAALVGRDLAWYPTHPGRRRADAWELRDADVVLAAVSGSVEQATIFGTPWSIASPWLHTTLSTPGGEFHRVRLSAPSAPSGPLLKRLTWWMQPRADLELRESGAPSHIFRRMGDGRGTQVRTADGTLLFTQRVGDAGWTNTDPSIPCAVIVLDTAAVTDPDIEWLLLWSLWLPAHPLWVTRHTG